MMKYRLLSESAYSADLSIDTLGADEIELVNQCIEVLNREKCISAYFLAVLDDVKGSLFYFNYDTEHVSVFTDLLDELELGYRVYEMIDCDERYMIAVAGSEERYERMPLLEADDYDGIEPTNEVGWFLGLDCEKDWSWMESDDNIEARRNLDETDRLDVVAGGEYSDRELYDFQLSSVSFYPDTDGLFRMCMFGRRIRSCCERFDMVSESLVGTLALQSSFAHKMSFCTTPPYEVFDSYLETRLRIGSQNWWSHTDSVRGLINTHKFGLDEWSVAEI